MMLSSLLNLHPATVHFPISFLVLASVAGLLYLFWKPSPPLLVLTWWPMLIGWISCALAVLTGLFAQSNLPPDAPYWQILNTHVTTGLAILLVYGAPLYLRWTRRARGATAQQLTKDDTENYTQDYTGYNTERNTEFNTKRNTDPLMDRPANYPGRWTAKYWVSFCLIVGALLVILTGWSGGQLVYSWGVNVGGQ